MKDHTKHPVHVPAHPPDELQTTGTSTITAPAPGVTRFEAPTTPVDFQGMTTDVRESAIAGEKDVVRGEAYAVTNKGLGVLLDSSDPVVESYDSLVAKAEPNRRLVAGRVVSRQEAGENLRLAKAEALWHSENPDSTAKYCDLPPGIRAELTMRVAGSR